MNQQPNIIVIMCDQLRWDALGYTGNKVVHTPNIDQLAHTGVTFSNAYSAVPSCIASRAALLTGMSQKKHGRTGYEDGVPFTYQNTLPGILVAAGYHTQSVGKNHFSPARNLCGYHNTVLMDGYLQTERCSGKNYAYVDDYVIDLQRTEGVDADMIFHGVDCNSYLSRPWPYCESMHPTSWVTTQGIDFLRRRDPTKPYFLKLSYVAPHPPYIPSQAFLDMYQDVDMPEPVIGDWAQCEEPLLDTNGAHGILSREQLNRVKKAYYAMVTQVDYQIGRFIMHLKEQGEYENTVILFLSDHGEMLGDHYLFRKAVPFNGSARIPLCMSWGRNVPLAKKRTHIDEVVEIRDIMPTLLQVASCNIPDSVDGLSLLPLIAGNTHWRQYLHGEHCLSGIPGYDTLGSNHYVVTKDAKYMWFSESGKELFFDLAKDPHECHNLIDAQSQQAKQLRDTLIQELSDREDNYIQNGALQSGISGRNTQSFLKAKKG